MTISLRVDLDSLHSLLESLGDKAIEAARPAAFAASKVLYDEVKRNVGKLKHVTGNLEKGIYQVYSKTNSAPGRATYHISWNARKAAHGGLVEFGHIQRYVTFFGKDGKMHTAVRPSEYGKPKPGRRATQAVKDAHYVLLKTPKQIAAQPFVRPAASKLPAALAAAQESLVKALTK